SIGIAWTENGDAEQWNIQYRAGNGQMSSDVSTSPSYVINDLEPGTLYQIQVQSVCGAQTSGWSSVVTAMTTNTGIVDYDRYVKVWPNPTSDYINVECRMQNVEYGMQDVEWGGVDIVDVYGKVVVVETFHETSPQTRYTTSLQTRINVSSLSAGMYFVRVATDQGFVIKPFVKR
ncbi:MAG: fibronectin type III domain-containing protein, partial [Bacteroidales bacterium]|nr:fibronectin type III domain-containing protein [Bacteroidales bacterium]